MNTQPNTKHATRQRNFATMSALAALLLMAVGTATASSEAWAVTANTTYVCVNKATSLVYFKAKCTKVERRVAFKTATATNGTNGIDGTKGESAYETWLKAGNLGTTTEFLRSLKGTDGSAGPAGTSANLPFFQRLEGSLTCDEKWRTVTTSVYANNQAGVDRQQALAGCAQPDWAKQYFQFPDANPITLVSTAYGTPTLANQQIRRNGVLVDDLYAPKKTTVTFSAVIAIQPPSGWALCTDADAQITALGETGYPKIVYDGVDATSSFAIVGNLATVSSSLSVVNTDQLRTSFFDLWLTTYICGPDTSTPSGLGRKTVFADLYLPAVNP